MVLPPYSIAAHTFRRRVGFKVVQFFDQLVKLDGRLKERFGGQPGIVNHEGVARFPDGLLEPLGSSLCLNVMRAPLPPGPRGSEVTSKACRLASL